MNAVIVKLWCLMWKDVSHAILHYQYGFNFVIRTEADIQLGRNYFVHPEEFYGIFMELIQCWGTL